MSVRLRVPLLAALAVLALLVPASAQGAVERTVSVTAAATLTVPNDSAGLSFFVARERRSRGAALRAVAAGTRGVIAAAQGVVGAGDVRTGRISVRKGRRGERTVYRASEGLSVTLHQPDNAGELVSAAIAAGASGVSGPRFFVGDTEAAFTAALTAAFDKVKTRASALAARAGATLGQVLTIDEGGGPELTPLLESASTKSASACSVALAGSGATVKETASRCTASPPPTKPGTSTVTATVHAVFALQ